jgi:hypothetical protein
MTKFAEISAAILVMSFMLNCADAKTALSEQEICDAVNSSRVVEFRHRDDPAGSERRRVFIHGLGHTNKNSTLVLALQIKGYSKPADGGGREPKMPGWRNFRLDRMLDAEVLDETFKPVRPDMSRYKSITSFVCKSSSVGEAIR